MITANKERYAKAAHAIQSGVAMQMALDQKLRSHKYRYKDLRTGLNLSKADQEGLATLLISKGVFTPEEYVEAVSTSAEKEQARMEAELSQTVNKVVKLA